MKTLTLHFALALLSVSLFACKGDKSNDEAGSKTGTSTKSDKAETAKPKAAPSQRTKYDSYRPLLAEAMRAELSVGGVVIDLGTADQHKYTRGNWKSGWSDPATDGQITYAAADAKRVDIELQSHQPIGAFVIRGRSATAGQKVSLQDGAKLLATLDIPAEWGEASVELKEPLPPGRHELSLIFGKGGSPRAEFDWLWFAESAGTPTPGSLPRVIPVRVGDEPRRALISPTARSYSFYLEPPKEAFLVFDYGAPQTGVTFVVKAQTDDGTEELFRAAADNHWQEKVVDLGKYAGKAIRLELTTEGDGGGWGEPEIMVTKRELPQLAGGNAKNVVFILIDTVRADVFSPFNPDNTVQTPTYDAFAKEATVFANAYNNENWTKPSVATSLSGLYPRTHKTKQDGSKLPEDIVILPQRLQKAGFKTGGFVANGYISGAFGFEKGWNHFRNYIREAVPTEAERVYGDALKWIEENKDERFFTYIQTIDPHVVYRVDKKYTDLYFDGNYNGWLGNNITAEKQIALSKKQKPATEADLNWLKALYYGEVTYHDEHMKHFLDKLEEMGLAEDTVIVVTNDHGEELGDHEKFGHGHSLYEELIRAPLAIRFPKRFAPGRVIEEVVEHVDLTPTILDLLGVESSAEADGISLMPLVEGRPERLPGYSVSEFLDGKRAVRVGGWKIIRSGGSAQLFDIANDPGETKEMTKTAHIARRMCDVYFGEGIAMPSKRERLQDAVARRDFEPSEADIDPEMRKQLEALGYFGE